MVSDVEQLILIILCFTK